MDQVNTINFEKPDAVDEAINKVEPDKRVKMKRRHEWGAVPPKHSQQMKPPIDKVILTPTLTGTCSSEWECIQICRELQQAHMAAGEPDIKYHFLVGGDGMIYEGRGYTTVGPKYPAYAKELSKMSKQCIDIGIIGTMGELHKKPVLRAVAHVGVMGRMSKYITPKFNLGMVHDNDILHMIPVTGEKLMESQMLI